MQANMTRDQELFNELKALLANYPEQRVDLEEDQEFWIFRGECKELHEGLEYDEDDDEYEDEDDYWESIEDDVDNYEEWLEESYRVNSIFIENDELRFDLTRNYYEFEHWRDPEELKNVTVDYIFDETVSEVDEDELEALIEFLREDDEEDEEDPGFEIKDGVALIPEGTTKIGDFAFDGCTSLKSVVIPDSVTEIGEFAFQDCTSLTTVTLPAGVEIEANAFLGCKALATIYVPAGEADYYKERLNRRRLRDIIVELDK